MVINFFRKYGDKLLFGLALVVLATALFRREDEESEAPAPVTNLLFSQWWQEDLKKDTLLELIREFESLHGDIKITLNTRSYEDLRLDLFIPPESSPGDIFALDPLWVPELVKRDIIENLWTESPLAESPLTESPGTESQGVESQWSDDPSQQAYNGPPLLSYINVLFYNIEMLREAGFARPPKSRGEFLDYARAVTNSEENRWGLTLGGNSSRGMYDDVYPWIWSAGARLITNERPALSSRQVMDSLSFLASLNRESLVVPSAFSAEDWKKTG